jgi:ABC-type glycerol-3-phosphate transport system substrate-binding protein
MFLATGWVPIRNSVRQDPEVRKADPAVAAIDQQATYPHPDFDIPEMGAFGQIWKAEMTDVLLNKRKVKDGLDAVVAKTKTLIAPRLAGG